MDLGSESSYAIFVTEAMMGDGLEVDLQHYAYTQAMKPLFHVEGGARSRGLRTRFFRATMHENWVTNGRINLDFVTQPFVPDPDVYHRQVVNGEQVNVNVAAQGPIRYFVPEGGGYPLSSWLPNAKVAFSILPHQKFQFKYDRDYISLVPRDIIKLQLGQILNQLVLTNPEVVSETERLYEEYGLERVTASMPLDIVLTVPNSYAPEHAGLIRDFVQEVCPEADVRTISESDAIAIDYYNKYYHAFVAGSDANPGDFNDYILTIDIGKGTTDATVASVELAPFELSDNRTAHRLQVIPCTRTGRVTGGAMLTYTFMECIQDLAINVLRGNKWVEKNPCIHTEETEGLDSLQPFVAHLIQVEEYCHQLKVNWDPNGHDILAGIPDQNLGRAVAVGMVQMWQHAALGSRDYDDFSVSNIAQNDFPTKYLNDGKESNEAIKQLASLLENPADLFKALSMKQTRLLENYGLDCDRAIDRFRKLRKDIDKYVHDNVDDVLMDLAFGMRSRVSEEAAEFRNAEEALSYFTKADDPTLASRRFKPAIHLVIAGKGSLFIPVKKRFLELADKVGVPVVDPALSNSQIRSRRKTWIEGFLSTMRSVAQILGHPPEEYSVQEAGGGLATSLIYLVQADECKVMCARGGRQWARHHVSTLRNLISGVLTLKVTSKGETAVDMRQLNEQKSWRYVFTDSNGLQLRACELVYAPSRYLSRRSDRSGMFAKPLQFDACYGIELKLENGQLEVYRLEDVDGELIPIRCRASIQVQQVTNIAHMPNEMFPMVWPAIMKPRSSGTMTASE